MFAAYWYYLASCELAADLVREWDRSDNFSSLSFSLSLCGACMFELHPLSCHYYTLVVNFLTSDAIRHRNVLKSKLENLCIVYLTEKLNKNYEKRHSTRIKNLPRFDVFQVFSSYIFLCLLFLFLSLFPSEA